MIRMMENYESLFTTMIDTGEEGNNLLMQAAQFDGNSKMAQRGAAVGVVHGDLPQELNKMAAGTSNQTTGGMGFTFTKVERTSEHEI